MLLMLQVKQYDQAVRLITRGDAEAAKGMLQQLLQEPMLQEQADPPPPAAAGEHWRVEVAADRLRLQCCMYLWRRSATPWTCNMHLAQQQQQLTAIRMLHGTTLDPTCRHATRHTPEPRPMAFRSQRLRFTRCHCCPRRCWHRCGSSSRGAEAAQGPSRHEGSCAAQPGSPAGPHASSTAGTVRDSMRRACKHDRHASGVQWGKARASCPALLALQCYLSASSFALCAAL